MKIKEKNKHKINKKAQLRSPNRWGRRRLAPMSSSSFCFSAFNSSFTKYHIKMHKTRASDSDGH